MDSVDYVLRKMREEDLGQVTAMEEATQVVPWTSKAFRDCYFAGYPGWVFENKNQILSFGIIAVHGEECHLLNICVHPQFQRHGLGTKMLNHVTDMAKKLGAMMIYLEVRESNHKAIALYKKTGFIHINIRKDYYPALEGREDALVFAKDLGFIV
ncbi:MAG TPA: ribosomal protein S18-alanine N-acetyltransferase [Gammaproteobacteria bacterium]|nr:ribosomal protein S18-alanine N-acetyltransferase [Gammaproteobacteria bacterium]